MGMSVDTEMVEAETVLVNNVENERSAVVVLATRREFPLRVEKKVLLASNVLPVNVENATILVLRLDAKRVETVAVLP